MSNEQQTLGYVVSVGEEHKTVCTDCVTLFGDSEGVIRDNDAYGEQVPYPECHDCGEVMRP